MIVSLSILLVCFPLIVEWLDEYPFCPEMLLGRVLTLLFVTKGTAICLLPVQVILIV